MCNSAFAPCDRQLPHADCARRPRRWSIALFIAMGIGLCGVSAARDGRPRPAPRFVWNASASLPVGLWRIEPGLPIFRGEIVLARLPRPAARFAATRRYLPEGVPILKRVAAVGGDNVCARGGAIFVNAVPVALRRTADTRGRPLPNFAGCEQLRRDRILLLSDHPDSFDGRYFGPTNRNAVIGSATLLWPL